MTGLNGRKSLYTLNIGFPQVRENGEFLTERIAFNKLKQNKRNWIIEYMIIRTVLREATQYIDVAQVKYSNIRYSNVYKFADEIHDIHGKKSNFFYKFLIFKKFKRHSWRKYGV